MINNDKLPNRIKRDRIIAVLVTVLWLLIFILLAILFPRPEPLHVVSCPQTPRSVVQSPDGHYVANQIVVIGADQAINTVVSQVPSIVPQPLENCVLDYVGQVPELAARSTTSDLFQRADLNTLNVRLYQVAAGTTVTDAVTALNQNGAGQRVYADPNYLTAGMMDAEACGNPNGTGGSPNGTGGSPNGTGGSPNGTGGSPNGTGGSPNGPGAPASAETYATQWAFEHIGLGAILQASYEAANVNYQGDRIRVGVFDTSPFTQTGTQSTGGAMTATEPITWVTPAFTLTVNTLPQQVQAVPTITSSSGISYVHVFSDVSDHGLFVAGLVHAVAPRSDIHLYPVLNKYACGDLYTLVTQLHAFISQVEADKQKGSLDGAVINLSLGVLRPRKSDAVTRTMVLTQTGDITHYVIVNTPNAELAQALAILHDNPVRSLLFTLHAADQLGITIVAAAGNDSWRDEYRTKPLAPQLPADYPFVIDVAGSNANRQRSCFSNWGDVSAPAGDGAPGQVPVVSGTEIISVTSSCAASFETPLIGPVITSTQFPRGYAKWNGTSFAAPLVSGLAALVLEAGVQPKGNWMQPSDVARAIKCGTSTTDGVIDVPTTLMRCMSP